MHHADDDRERDRIGEQAVNRQTIEAVPVGLCERAGIFGRRGAGVSGSAADAGRDCELSHGADGCDGGFAVAIRDVDSEYQKLGTVASVSAETVTEGTLQFPAPAAGFYRFAVSALTGDGTIVAKLAP